MYLTLQSKVESSDPVFIKHRPKTSSGSNALGYASQYQPKQRPKSQPAGVRSRSKSLERQVQIAVHTGTTKQTQRAAGRASHAASSSKSLELQVQIAVQKDTTKQTQRTVGRASHAASSSSALQQIIKEREFANNAGDATTSKSAPKTITIGSKTKKKGYFLFCFTLLKGSFTEMQLCSCTYT